MHVSFERRGAGPAVVLVHGIGSRWQCFDPILDRLAQEREVWAVDMPGFGASPADPAVTPGPIGYAAWLTGWLREQGVEQPHVVGSSMGGGVALEMARQGAASRVTAFAPAGFYGRAGVTWARGLLTSLRAVGHVTPVVERLVASPTGRAVTLGAVVAHPARISPEHALEDVRALVGGRSFADARRALGTYRVRAGDLGQLPQVPTTVVWGSQDRVLLPGQARTAREVLPLAHHVTLPGAGHLPFSDDPDTCADLVLAT